MTKRVLLVVGPTAVGKTEISIRVAKLLGAEIVSADSRQVYKYMDIGTAKPTKQQLSEVRHHFVDIKYPDEYYSAGEYAREARQCIEALFESGRQPVVVGGSGLYIRALVDGIFDPKVADRGVKNKLKKEAEKEGIQTLYEKLKEVDPVTARRLHATDTQRILRALEVYEITGRPFSEFLQHEPRPADFEPFFVGLTMDRQQLYSRINRRVDQMMAAGFLEEVESLRKRGYGPELNALRTVGYREAFEFLDGKLSRDEMVELIKQRSRNYAKRQWTWFRKDARIQWVAVDAFAKLSDLAGHIVDLFLNSADSDFSLRSK